jgi:hypothetical protein
VTSVVVGILSMIVLGIPATLAVDRRASPPLLLGTAFLYGSGIVFLALLALSIVHVSWTVVSVTIVALMVWLLSCWVVRLLGSIKARPSNPATQQPQLKPHWLDLATLLTIIGYAMYATIAPLWEWDFWAIWGLKARIFLERGAIDWHFLESRWNTFAHPDYPLLLPLNLDFLTLWNGGWSDRWLGALFVAWAAALLLIVRDLAERESSTLPAAVATLTVASLAVSRYIGLAEGPLIAFGAAGVLFIRHALQTDDRAAWLHGGLLLGLAANVKNEGIALLVTVGIALLMLRPRALIRLWPAAAIAAPWLILRVTHVLPTDIVTGSALGRALYRLPYTFEILVFLARRLYEPWFWVAVLAGVIIIPSVTRRREAFVLVVTAVQLAFYIGSYYATPHDARWHVATSWSRLTDQIALPITYVVVLALAKYAAGMEHSPPHAEAGPVQ